MQEKIRLIQSRLVNQNTTINEVISNSENPLASKQLIIKQADNYIGDLEKEIDAIKVCV